MEKQLETLSVERLDDDFIKVFQPIHSLQMIFGCLKVNMKYGFVTHPSPWYMSYCVTVWTLNIFATVRFVTECELASDAIFETVFLKIGHVTYITTIFVTFLQHHFCNRNKMSTFYVSLQRIDRTLGIESRSVNQSVARRCLLVSGAVTTLNILWIVLYDLFLVDGWRWYTYPSLSPSIGSHLDMLLCFVILYYILKRFEYIEGQIYQREVTFVGRDEKQLRCTWDRTLNGLQLATKCISDFVDLFQYQILTFTSQLLLWTVLTVQCVIEKIERQKRVSISSAAYVFFTLLSLGLLMVILCRLADMLASRIDNIRTKCSDILSSNTQGVSRLYARRLLLFMEVDSGLTVYGVYTLSSRLPFQLFAIIASYTIILLQFAML